MVNPISQSTSRRPLRWLRLAAVVVIAAIVVYRGWEQERQPPAMDRPADSPPTAAAPDTTSDTPATNTPAESPSAQTIVRQQTIRDSHGHVAFRGDIDLSSTLHRIRRGDRLKYSHDGAMFENRERRLPRQPAGYYREFVHPTPHVSGPGPQRIVIGKGGETYYTPDHYRTFRRLDDQRGVPIADKASQ